MSSDKSSEQLMQDRVFTAWEAFSKETDTKQKKEKEKAFTQMLRVLSVESKAVVHERIEEASNR